VDDGSLFVEQPPARRSEPARIEEVGARSLDPVGEIELVRGWTAIAVVDATALTVPRRLLRRERERDVDPNLFWIDARTGGAGCVWAFAAPARGEHGQIPVRIPSRPGVVHRWELDDADVSALDPLSAPADAADIEQRALADLSGELRGGWRDGQTGSTKPFIRGVAFLDIGLEGSWPDTAVAAVFEADQRPGFRFVRRFGIWAPNGTRGDLSTDAINLMEDVEACGYGLPTDPEPGDDGLVPF
jgi:hypothetical protein